MLTMKVTTEQHFLTSGDIAKIVGESFARVRWLLRTRGIEPVGRVGIVWIYDTTAVDQVRSALAATDQRRSTVPAA